MPQSLRSIFRTLKGRKAVFVNTTTRIRNPSNIKNAPIAIDLAQVRTNLIDGRPATEALTALLPFHTVRIYQLAKLKLTDLHDGCLHINDRVILLAEPARERLSTYLDHRQNTRPTSVNPHTFIQARNWTNTRPCTNWWIRKQLGTSGDRIRQDRILDEAHANGGDMRDLCDLFGLSITGAARYATPSTRWPAQCPPSLMRQALAAELRCLRYVRRATARHTWSTMTRTRVPSEASAQGIAAVSWSGSRPTRRGGRPSHRGVMISVIRRNPSVPWPRPMARRTMPSAARITPASMP